MNFKRFAVATTNIFPVANSTAGGQLLTEYNLRSRESVCTDSSVEYMIGPSYTHSERDFEVRTQETDDGVKISSSTLEILPGRAIVNGHFIESLAPILIDLSAANANRPEGCAVLKGELSVGLKVMYSTKSTMAGSMLVENNENVYEGIQIVVLPSNEFLLPNSNKSTMSDESVVTAHLKLADFIYLNGKIINIVNNKDKSTVLSADRIGEVDKLLSDVYVTKTGLNTANHHYVFSSKSIGEDIQDTWCSADESLMVWDKAPRMYTKSEMADLGLPLESQAAFGIKSSQSGILFPYSQFHNIANMPNGSIFLNIPHKQVDTAKDTSGSNKYYADVQIPIPVADYGSESSGTVNSEYTKHIKQLRNELNNIHSTNRGKQRGYVEVLTSRYDLPPINPGWDIGDYILVRNDCTFNDDIVQNATVTLSTMYAVLPGSVSGITPILYKPEGCLIDYKESDTKPDTKNCDTYNEYWAIKNSSVSYRGTKDKDYFQYRWIKNDDSYEDYYYKVGSEGDREYSDPIFLTGQIGLAETEIVGGFYNVTDSDLDAGYVYLDETGHLRLLDYALLRSGTLAYQLGEDWDSGEGLTLEAIQDELNDKVNQRVAFKTIGQSSDTTNVVNVYLRLDSNDDSDLDHITIRDIDSRFNTYVYLHVSGKPSKQININVVNCQKMRIDSNIPDNVHFNLIGTCIYYDVSVFNNAMSTSNSVSGLSIWYEQFDSADPDLVINNMTVTSRSNGILTDDINYWENSYQNDLHYKYALDSITFDDDGTISRMSMIFQNDCTDNIELGSRIIVDQLKLSPSDQLPYPINCMNNMLKISGSFITAYPTTEKDDVGQGYIVYDSNVTVVTNAHNVSDDEYIVSGTLSIFVKSEFITNFIGLDFGNNIDGWDTNSYHRISGGIDAYHRQSRSTT